MLNKVFIFSYICYIMKRQDSGWSCALALCTEDMNLIPVKPQKL